MKAHYVKLKAPRLGSGLFYMKYINLTLFTDRWGKSYNLALHMMRAQR